MIDFFRKIKLIQTFSIPIPIDQIEFVKLCRTKIQIKEDSFFSRLSEYFVRKKFKYVGIVEHKGLKIRKRKKIFTLSKNSCTIDAFLREKEGVLYLETTIKPYSNFKICSYILIAFSAIFYVLLNLIKSPDPIFTVIFAFFILSFFLLGIPLFILKLRIKAMKIQFNEDLYHWILKM